MQYSLRHPPFHQMDTQNEKEMLLRSCLPNEKRDMYENGKKKGATEREEGREKSNKILIK